MIIKGIPNKQKHHTETMLKTSFKGHLMLCRYKTSLDIFRFVLDTKYAR